MNDDTLATRPSEETERAAVGPLTDALLPHLHEAEFKAWDSLSRYKFQMFGYWAAIWVHLNRIGGFNLPNPWRDVVRSARNTLQPFGERPESAPLPQSDASPKKKQELNV